MICKFCKTGMKETGFKGTPPYCVYWTCPNCDSTHNSILRSWCKEKLPFHYFEINCPFCDEKIVSDVIDKITEVNGQWQCNNGHTFCLQFNHIIENGKITLESKFKGMDEIGEFL